MFETTWRPGIDLVFRDLAYNVIGLKIGFPMGRDSATFRDKGTEVPSLSRDKGTKGQAQNLAKEGKGLGQPVKIWDGT